MKNTLENVKVENKQELPGHKRIDVDSVFSIVKDPDGKWSIVSGDKIVSKKRFRTSWRAKAHIRGIDIAMSFYLTWLHNEIQKYGKNEN